MDRRTFLKLTGTALAATAIPSAALALAPEPPKAPAGLTGLPTLDQALEGFPSGNMLWMHASYRGDLHIGFAINCIHNAFLQGKRVAFVSHEISNDYFFARLLSQHSQFLPIKPLTYLETMGGIQGTAPGDDRFVATYRDMRTGPYGSIKLFHLQGGWDLLGKLPTADELGAQDLVVFEQATPPVLEIAQKLKCPVLVLAQLPLHAKQSVEEGMGGHYTMRSVFMCNMNAAQRADVITTSYSNHYLRRDQEVRIQMLKNRYGKAFDTFLTPVDFRGASFLLNRTKA